MNRIFWDNDKISMVTDHIEAVKHSHQMMQFFLSLQYKMEI